MADDAKAVIQKERETREKNIAEFEKRQGRPTPTQEENDLAALGVAVLTHEDDGSGPDPRVAKHDEPQPPRTGYQTRQARPATPSS